MASIDKNGGILAQFEKIGINGGPALRGVGSRARFNDLVEKIKKMIDTNSGFPEAQAALFLFETGRVNNPRPITCKSVESNPTEKNELIKRINLFLERLLLANQEKEKFEVAQNWNFAKEVIALNRAVLKTESMEAKGISIEYSVVETDES